MKKLILAIAVAACGGGTSSSPPPAAPASSSPPPPESAEKPAVTSETSDVVAQAALAEQYDAGKKVYVDKECASCHGDHGEGNPKNPAVIGPGALPEQAPAQSKLRKGLAFETAKDVLEFVKAKMPIKHPGTLADNDAAAVTSWILSESKVAIDRPLDASNAAAVKLR